MLDIVFTILCRAISSVLDVALVGSGCLPSYQWVATPLTVMLLEVVVLLSMRSQAKSTSAEPVMIDL
eukprot:7802698-Ditylum_brightwellii.AAC.1